MTIRNLAIATLAWATFATSAAPVEAWGYRPDTGGYAYQDSCCSPYLAPLVPVGVVVVGVIVGVVLRRGHHAHGAIAHTAHAH